MDTTTFTRRYSRRGLPKPNAAYYLWRFVGNGGRTLRAATTRLSHDGVRAIAHRLAADGIVMEPSERFLSGSGQSALASAAAGIITTSETAETEAFIASAHGSRRKKKFLLHLVSYPDGIPADDPLLRVALDPKLLEIVASYLGMWPSLYSIAAWLNFPTDAPAELSQVWHRDPEDLQLVKAFIYLSDVGDRSGPFTYLPKTQSFGTGRKKAQNLFREARRVQDPQMTFPPETWKVCTGPANTMILADTVGYHCGGKPTEGRRTLVTLTFTSGTPIDDSGLWLRERPTWATLPIQRLATRWLLDGQRRRTSKRKRH